MGKRDNRVVSNAGSPAGRQRPGAGGGRPALGSATAAVAAPSGGPRRGSRGELGAASARAAARLRRPRPAWPARSRARPPKREGGWRWGRGGRADGGHRPTAREERGLRRSGREALEGRRVTRRRERGRSVSGRPRGPLPPDNKGGLCPAEPGRGGRPGGTGPGRPAGPGCP